MFYSHTLHFAEYSEEFLRTCPQLKPYEGLASIWHDFASRTTPNYSAFIRHMAKGEQLTSWSVLDLACGTGVLASQLSRYARDVTGLDLSEAMIEQARAKTPRSRETEYVLGDFRDFNLGRTFDFAVCGCNSMNYVNNIAELRTILVSVAKHLRPGGLFVFDTLTELGMRILSGLYLHVKIGATRFVMRFQYDPEIRKENAEVLMPLGIETHVQIPIDVQDIFDASCNSGLELVDSFSSAFISARRYTGPFRFFVMRRSDSTNTLPAEP